MAQMWDPVVVTWRDAYTSTHQRSKDLLRHKIDPCVRRSVGFVLRDDEDNIVICMEDDRDACEAVDTDQDCETVTVIPRSMVVKVDDLTIRRARRADEPENDK